MEEMPLKLESIDELDAFIARKQKDNVLSNRSAQENLFDMMLEILVSFCYRIDLITDAKISQEQEETLLTQIESLKSLVNDDFSVFTETFKRLVDNFTTMKAC